MTYRPDFFNCNDCCEEHKCAGCDKTFAELWKPVFECKECQKFFCVDCSYERPDPHEEEKKSPVDTRSYK